jgi:hypothetical protein
MNSNSAQSKTDEKLRAHRSRASFSLATVLCAVVILLVISACVLSLGLHNRGFTFITSFYISVLCSAYVGLTKAFFEMNKKLKVIHWNYNLPKAINEIYSIAPENQLLKCLTE